MDKLIKWTDAIGPALVPLVVPLVLLVLAGAGLLIYSRRSRG